MARRGRIYIYMNQFIRNSLRRANYQIKAAAQLHACVPYYGEAHLHLYGPQDMRMMVHIINMPSDRPLSMLMCVDTMYLCEMYPARSPPSTPGTSSWWPTQHAHTGAALSRNYSSPPVACSATPFLWRRWTASLPLPHPPFHLSTPSCCVTLGPRPRASPLDLQ